MEPRPTEPPFMTVREASAVCGIEARTIQRRIKAGAFPGGRTVPGSRKYVVNRQVFLDWWKGGEHEGETWPTWLK